MEWVETTGKTVEEAKDAALDQLGVDESDAEFEILEEPRTGLFGRVRGQARIRARIQPARPRPKVERRDRRRREGGSGGGGNRARRPAGGAKSAPSTAGSAAGTKAAPRKAATAARGKGRAAAAPDAPAADTEGDAVDTGAAATGASRGEPRRGRGGARDESRAPRTDDDGAIDDRDRGTRRRPAKRAATAAPNTPAETDETDAATASPEASGEGSDMGEQDVTVEEQAELMATFLDGLVDAFGLDGSIEQVRVDADTMEVQVVGDDLGLLIGPKGQTLSAVQELARTYVQRKATGTHHGRVRIDVGGYRQRRREALERFTRQVADQVVSSGVQKALEPMNASDRKVVHDTANTIDGVRTLSEGEEPRRRVVIAPA